MTIYTTSMLKDKLNCNDMANYLGITQETVSRQLSELKSNKILSIKNKQVELC